jgi:hypothetical protein
MKKILALVLTLTFVFALTACGGADPAAKSEGVMTYAEYDAAPLDSEVVIEAYVQAKQSWWEDKATVYAQDPDGAYFLYDMACSAEDYEKLTVGTKIRVTGFKGAWEGEVEIMDATFEIGEGTTQTSIPKYGEVYYKIMLSSDTQETVVCTLTFTTSDLYVYVDNICYDSASLIALEVNVANGTTIRLAAKTPMNLEFSFTVTAAE